MGCSVASLWSLLGFLCSLPFVASALILDPTSRFVLTVLQFPLVCDSLSFLSFHDLDSILARCRVESSPKWALGSSLLSRPNCGL